MINIGLNPVFIGHDLDSLYSMKDITKGNTKYLVLVLGYDGDGGRNRKPDPSRFVAFLEKSFQPNEAILPGERYFPEIGLTLNIRDARNSNDHYTDISEPGRLITYKLGG
jgi:hypothetical protein